ncbi:hypothetical protein ESB00_18315 [Oleiharenicola lentus]|uniref:Beta-hexosaminidase bacterial type N-terminal domain-containing protein n=1 Tax=Oleiharenicola lentus TaxID=2508720 RepID=A0A4Q1C5N1_9BACT|nr:hypothetical protein [Oleiharenicola lentus]RXK53643.1 hypothetical protein ESB00_18315 [Oleiharenicola lentus]
MIPFPSLRSCLLFAGLLAATGPARAAVEAPADASPRIRYGIERLQRALPAQAPHIIVRKETGVAPKEGFILASAADGTITLTGADDSGVLYGCLELAERLRSGWPKGPQQISDAPVMVLRGPCIGMQKTYYLPGRKVYEYPYTPEEFPFFYDKAYWTEYLDHLADLRMNTLYLWNGHPFASLVRLPDYPEAVEVSDEVFAKNVEMFRWLTAECDRRGIWLVQQFYSILISKPLAEKHGLDSQLHAWNDLAADYTRKSIAAFVREFPNVGLMPCLGEALQEQNAQTRWMTDVIIPGVKDGMAAAGLTKEPPIVLRTHATDATKVMPEALKGYKNLYTEAKFNGESLTTWEPRGVRQQLHLTMSQVGSTHLANVHILANLEPFRYGATEFIQKSVLAMRDRLGAHGLHLYPLFYWDWPVSPDITPTPLKQWERDWIWFEAWARYAWNPDRDPIAERAHWTRRLAAHYGADAAPFILDAYNAAGECAPRILRRYGITEGNRQTMALGMTLDQLVRPEKYREFPELWESQSPPGERLKEYAERAWKKLPHEGETPVSINAEVLAFSAQAAAAIDRAAPLVTRNREEFNRLRNDVHAIRAMSQNYVAKTRAALAVLRYGYSKDLADMVLAEENLAESLVYFRRLTELTKDAYSAANSMQTAQRRIPVPGGIAGKRANYHWTQLLPVYEKELTEFQAQVAALKNPAAAQGRTHAPLTPAAWKLLTPGLSTYTVQVGNTVFPDAPAVFTAVAPELEGLQGIGLRRGEPDKVIDFECSEPVRVLIGYFHDRGPGWRQPPTLETDATAADRGGAEPFIVDAVKFDALPAATVHAFDYPAGRHTLQVRGTGTYLILGIVRPIAP